MNNYMNDLNYLYIIYLDIYTNVKQSDRQNINKTCFEKQLIFFLQ